MEKLRRVGRTGGLALLYFELMTTVALIVGLCVVNLLRPGAGLNIDVATLDTSQVGKYTGPGKLPGVVEFLLNIVPDTFVGAFSSGEVLQVLLLALLDLRSNAAGGRDNPVYPFVDRLTQVLFAIVNIVMKAAPLGRSARWRMRLASSACTRSPRSASSWGVSI